MLSETNQKKALFTVRQKLDYWESEKTKVGDNDGTEYRYALNQYITTVLADLADVYCRVSGVPTKKESQSYYNDGNLKIVSNG